MGVIDEGFARILAAVDRPSEHPARMQHTHRAAARRRNAEAVQVDSGACVATGSRYVLQPSSVSRCCAREGALVAAPVRVRGRWSVRIRYGADRVESSLSTAQPPLRVYRARARHQRERRISLGLSGSIPRNTKPFARRWLHAHRIYNAVAFELHGTTLTDIRCVALDMS
jgi:hypothetical protein